MIGLAERGSPLTRPREWQFETLATAAHPRLRMGSTRLRGNDYLSRGTRKQQSNIEAARVHKLEADALPRAGRSEIAREMN